MKGERAAGAAALGDNDEIRSILEDVCTITQMGFAAVARVAESRWIVCQVLDTIERMKRVARIVADILSSPRS